MTLKSADAFRTISEVAEDLEVPQHVLRFWEGKFSAIRPLKRGGGRRYYRPDDVDLLRGIRRLLHVEGYTIKGVQKVLRDQGAKVVAELGRGGLARLEPPSETDESPEVSDVADMAGDEGLSSAARQHLLHALTQLEKARACLAAVIERPVGDGYIAPPQTPASAGPNPDGV